MNLFQLECFLAVAGHLNFARAAEQMNITQPSMTHQIQSLEKELTVKLFHRSTRSVELTVEGRIFLTDAKTIVGMSQAAIHRFTQGDHREILDLAIGCHGLTGLPIPPQTLSRLAVKYPELRPRVYTLPDTQLMTRLEEGSLDAALTVRRSGKRPGGLQYREVGTVAFQCVMRANHPLAGKQSLTLGDLQGSHLILYEPGYAGPEMTGIQSRFLEARKPSELSFCESHEVAMLLVCAGFGIAFLPNTYRLPDGIPELVCVPLEGLEPIPYGIYYQSVREKPHLRDFITFLQEDSRQDAADRIQEIIIAE